MIRPGRSAQGALRLTSRSAQDAPATKGSIAVGDIVVTSLMTRSIHAQVLVIKLNSSCSSAHASECCFRHHQQLCVFIGFW